MMCNYLLYLYQDICSRLSWQVEDINGYDFYGQVKRWVNLNDYCRSFYRTDNIYYSENPTGNVFQKVYHICG